MGGTWLDEDRKLNLTSPEAVQSLDLYARLLRNYGPPGVTGFNWPECQAIMLQGQGAMWTDGANLFSVLEDPSKSKVVGQMAYGLVPPGPGGQQVALLGGTGIAINPFGTKKDAAFLFTQWSTNKKNQLRMLIDGGSPVGRESAWRSPEFAAKNRMPKEWVDSALQAIQTFVPLVPDIIPIAEFRDIFGVAVTKAIEGADPETVLKEATAEFEPIYAKSEQS
jgi:multiple sugar transport system substrate-binding protein